MNIINTLSAMSPRLMNINIWKICKKKSSEILTKITKKPDHSTIIIMSMPKAFKFCDNIDDERKKTIDFSNKWSIALSVCNE